MRGPVRRLGRWGAGLLVIGAPACKSTPAPLSAGVVAPPSGQKDELVRDLMAFAHDSMRGRETGTPDAVRAAAFIGRRLSELGLEPYGDSLYYQRVPLVRQFASAATEMTVERNGVTRRLRVGQDLSPMLSLGPGQPVPRRFVDGELAFAGYVDASPLSKADEQPSAELLNKVAVILHGAPPGTTGALRDSLNSDNALALQIARVGMKLPAGIIVLMTPETEKLYRELYPMLAREVRSASAAPLPPNLAALDLPILLFGVARQGSPFVPRSWPDDVRPQSLGTSFRAAIDVRSEPFVGYNVIGRVPGTDPALRGTYVALGAHYDHVGILPPMSGDSIANGADDDGSGTVALLAVARAMAQRPSRRSTLFIFHTAEEKGLLGSAYFADHPTLPIDSMVAMLNADMIGRNGRDQLFLIGPQAAERGLSARLGQIIDSVNAGLPTPFTFDRGMDVQNHPRQFYQRSDHFNYAKKGVPVAFLTSGEHPEYHDVGDSADRIDFEKLRRVTGLLVEVTRAVGNDPNRPRR